MKIDVRVSRWRDSMSVQFDAEVGEVLTEQWSDGIELVMVDRTVLVRPGSNGVGYLNRTRTSSLSWPVCVLWDLRGRGEGAIESFFGLTELTAELDKDWVLTVEVPPIHETAWPGALFKLTPEEWIDVIEERLRSTIAAGLKSLSAPDHVRRMSGLWAEALRRSRK